MIDRVKPVMRIQSFSDSLVKPLALGLLGFGLLACRPAPRSDAQPAAPPEAPPVTDSGLAGPLEERIAAPPGFQRIEVSEDSFGAWLRRLPLRAGRPEVLLYNGRAKSNQAAHYAVVDLDVGSRDLQQCADAVMRLRAEYLLARGCDDAIGFRFTSGDMASWSVWRRGERPVVKGNSVSWRRQAEEDASYENFRRYLDVVFTYAGTASLEKELETVTDPLRLEPGDVFIQGGFPGHAVIVADVAEDASGRRLFLLAQSFMPAQDIHVLRHPSGELGPWYEARSSGELVTPEWRFRYEDLKRFPSATCSG